MSHALLIESKDVKISGQFFVNSFCGEFFVNSLCGEIIQIKNQVRKNNVQRYNLV